VLLDWRENGNRRRNVASCKANLFQEKIEDTKRGNQKLSIEEGRIIHGHNKKVINVRALGPSQ
jgi:hypothetical protein